MDKIHLHLILIFFSLLFSFSPIQSQDYHPMPDSEAQWDITRCWSFYPGGWHDEYSIQMDGSDTIINGKIYQKLYIVTHHLPGTEHDSVYTHFLGGMRESGKQVFFISEYLCLDTIERMIYDFNEVATGDTIFTQILTNGLTQFIPHIVTDVDFVLVGDETHRRIHLRDENDFFSEYWIEGVGSSLGLVYASYWLLTDNSYDLNCFYDQNELAFTNTDPGYFFCTFPLPFIECDSTLTSIPPIQNDYSIIIYPNPATNVLHIESNVEIEEVRIIDGCGQEVMIIRNSSVLDLDKLHPGIYFIRLIGNHRLVQLTQKLVKI